MTVLYRNPCYSEGSYIEVDLYYKKHSGRVINENKGAAYDQ